VTAVNVRVQHIVDSERTFDLPDSVSGQTRTTEPVYNKSRAVARRLIRLTLQSALCKRIGKARWTARRAFIRLNSAGGPFSLRCDCYKALAVAPAGCQHRRKAL